VIDAPVRARAVRRTFASGGSSFTLTIEELTLERGSCVAVIGPSGSGKSTLLGLLSLALRPDAGEALEIAGTDALALWRHGKLDGLAALRARNIGYVPQTAALLPFLSLRGNIALPQEILSAPDPALVDSLAAWLDIVPVLGRRPAAVSVGQRQRAAVARAMAHRPPIILADEPTAAVHPVQAEAILRHLVAYASDASIALLITTHDQARAEAAGFRIAVCVMEHTGTATRFAWVP